MYALINKHELITDQEPTAPKRSYNYQMNECVAFHEHYKTQQPLLITTNKGE